MPRNENRHLASLARLAAGATTGLTLRCDACKRAATIPIADLIARHGGDSVAVEIAARHVCGRCGARATTWWEHAGAAGAPREFKY